MLRINRSVLYLLGKYLEIELYVYFEEYFYNKELGKENKFFIEFVLVRGDIWE